MTMVVNWGERVCWWLTAITQRRVQDQILTTQVNTRSNGCCFDSQVASSPTERRIRSPVPSPKTPSESACFLAWISCTRCSTVLPITTRSMKTSFFCPSLCTRSKACQEGNSGQTLRSHFTVDIHTCWSTALLHPASSDITRFPRVRFKPTPPALRLMSICKKS